MVFFMLLALVAVALAQGGPVLHDQAWEDYKLQFNKHYTSEEEPMRYANWKKDTEEVDVHNAMYGQDFTQAVNELSDLTKEEYERLYCSSLIVPEEEEFLNGTMFVPSNKPIPESIDWRQQGMVTSVKDQDVPHGCGSCYTFSATGALEGQWKKHKGTLPSLSQQQLLDCSGDYGTDGCTGGWYYDCWEYLIAAGGNQEDSTYPYEGQKKECRFDKSKAVATVKDFWFVQKNDENDLTKALATIGPVSVSVDSKHDSFRRYRSGVHFNPECSTEDLNHAILAVGYGSEGGKDYYLVKNSWGTKWGNGGYIKMARNKNNNCGIASRASYPIV